VRVFVVREYTKMHEEQLAGTPGQVAAALGEVVRGEIAFAIGPYTVVDATPAMATAAEIDALLGGGHRVGEVAKLLAARGLGERHELYARASARKARRKTSIKER
jgi:16S rRNA C1402 (ribose-2'-O) methylase RsmI